MHCYLYERLANLGACYTPIHRCLYFGLSIGLSSNAQVAVLCACHLILVNIISGHRRRRLLNQPPASLGRISVIPVDADICWGKPSRRLSVMLGGLSSRSAECLLPSPRGDTERLPWHTACQAGVVGGSFCTDTR